MQWMDFTEESGSFIARRRSQFGSTCGQPKSWNSIPITNFVSPESSVNQPLFFFLLVECFLACSFSWLHAEAFNGADMVPVAVIGNFVDLALFR